MRWSWGENQDEDAVGIATRTDGRKQIKCHAAGTSCSRSAKFLAAGAWLLAADVSTTEIVFFNIIERE